MALSKDPEKRARQLQNLRPKHFGDKNPNAGRKPSMLSSVLREMEQRIGVAPSEEEIRSLLLMLPFETEESLKRNVANKDLDMVRRTYSKAILDKGGLKVIQECFSKVLSQKVDITSNGKDIKQDPIVVEVIDKTSQVERNEE